MAYGANGEFIYDPTGTLGTWDNTVSMEGYANINEKPNQFAKGLALDPNGTDFKDANGSYSMQQKGAWNPSTGTWDAPNGMQWGNFTQNSTFGEDFKEFMSNPAIMMAGGFMGAGMLGGWGGASGLSESLSAGNLSSLGAEWGGGSAATGGAGAGGAAADAAWGTTVGTAESGLDMTRLLDPSYWNEMGGTTGLAEAGASGVAGSTATYTGGLGATGESLLGQLATKIGTQGAQSLFSSLMKDGLTTDNVSKLIAALGPAALGLLGSSAQSNTVQSALNQARTDRQPSLDYYNQLLSMGPSGFAAGEGSQAVKGILHQLSATGGNPWGSGTSVEAAAKGLETLYGNRLSQAAGPAGLVSGTALMQGGINSASTDANMYNSLGSAASSVFGTPKATLEDYYKMMQTLA